MTWLGMTALGVVFVVGFVEILGKRFAEGGIYPHYASFRSDPMGTSAFFETLQSLVGVEVTRNIEGLDTIEGLDNKTVVLLLGLPRESLDSLRVPEDSALMKAVKAGARIVVTINPQFVPEMFRRD